MKRHKEILSHLKLHENTLNIHFVIKNMSYITFIFLDENSFIEWLRLSSGKKIFWRAKPLSYINRGNAVNAHCWFQLRLFFFVCLSKYTGSMAFVSLVGHLLHFISVDIFLLFFTNQSDQSGINPLPTNKNFISLAKVPNHT